MKILSDILSATILFSIPLLLVALGGMFSERSGVINIALEGIMVIGALCACLTLRALDQSTTIGTTAPQLGMLIAILVASVTGALFSLLLAFASVSLKADQTIGGTALNMMAPRHGHCHHLGGAGTGSDQYHHPHMGAHHAGNAWRCRQGYVLSELPV